MADGKGDKVYTLKDYFVNPDADPIKAITALKGKYDHTNFISGVDAAVRGTFTLSTSILKGTYKATLGATKFINDISGANKKIVTTMETLIGTENTDNFFSYTDEVKKDAVRMYREVGKQMANFSVGKDKARPSEMIGGLTSTAIKQLKLEAMAMAGFNFKLDDIVKNALIIDIETGGLFKDAPILQIAMGDMARLDELKKTVGASDHTAALGATDAIERMSPKEQMAQGFLSMNLVPEAIIRDVEDAPDGSRKATFRSFSYIPRSEAEFKQRFGTWASGKFPWLSEFYEEYGEGPTGDKIISEARIQELQKQLQDKGYVELKSGQRVYSQKEGAKYSMLFAKEGSKQGRTLMAANLPYESFRVGKLWEHFLTQKGSGVQDAFEPSLENHGNYLNKDKDVVKAFGGKITSLRDMRSMLSATWRSERKRNILDANNFFFTEQARVLKEQGKNEDLISLLPAYVKNVSAGLNTRDQLDLTKMAFSGLMQTGLIETSGDVASGTNINLASQIILGFDEAHKALSDVMVQGRLLQEGKLGEVVSDISNIYRGKESGSALDQVRSVISSLSILGDSKKLGWLELAKVKDTNLEIDSSWLGDDPLGSRQGSVKTSQLRGVTRGTHSELTRSYNLDKELLRLSETVDSYTGVSGGLYAPNPAKMITHTYTDEAGALQTINVNPAMHEAFSMPMAVGKVKHTMLTGSGTEVSVLKTQSDWNIQNFIRDEYQRELSSATSSEVDLRFGPGTFENLQGLGHSTEDIISNYLNTPGPSSPVLTLEEMQTSARSKVKKTLIKRYAEGDNLKAKGINAEDLETRLGTLKSGLSSRHAAGTLFSQEQIKTLGEQGISVTPNMSEDEVSRASLALRMSGADGFKKDMDSALMPVLQGIKDRLGPTSVAQRASSAADFLYEAISERKKELVATGEYSTPKVQTPNYETVGKVYNFATSAKDKLKLGIDTLGSVLFSPRGLESGLLSKMSGASPEISEYIMKNAGRGIRMMGGAGIIAAGVSGNYMLDMPSYKPTTKDILKMSGDERKIYNPEDVRGSQSGGMKNVMVATNTNIDKMNPAGFAVSAIDSSKVDYAVGDADTVEIISKGFMGIGQRKLGSVRLSGIDAPETAHEGFGGPGEMPFSQPGKQYLSNVLSARSGATVAVGQGSTFGRSVGIVTDDSGINYSYEMVNQGLATILYRNSAQEDLVSQKQFNAAERVARASNKGLFADPFYAGVHVGVGGKERKGYNVLSPSNAYKFKFDRSPGTSKQQAIEASQARNEEMSYAMDMSYNDYNEIFHSVNALSSNRKNVMADMQTVAMAGGLERNRGRRKERR